MSKVSPDFIMKRWTVTVLWSSGNRTSGDVTAPTRGKALADTWRSDAFNGSTFKEFLKWARCRRAPEPPQWGDPITVRCEPAFYLGCDGQYVHIVYPGKGVVLHSHPLDVLSESYRPSAYWSAAA